MSFLIANRGPDTGRRYPLHQFPATLGRDQVNDVTIADEEVSRFHVRIKKRGRLYILEDLDSKNGTFLNGDRVLNSIIQSGDKILVGNTELTFVAAEASIQFAESLTQYDMLLTEDLGITAPIQLGGDKSPGKFSPVRISPDKVMERANLSNEELRSLNEKHTNVNVAATLEEAAQSVLKAISGIFPKASRAAFFLWMKNQRQLIPIAVRHYKKKSSFLLSQRSFEDVVARKFGVLLQFEHSSPSTQAGRNRLVLPILFHQDPMAVIHIETDTPTTVFAPAEIDLAQIFLNKIAPVIECFLLRRELDQWAVGMIDTMIAAIEAKDTYTHGHSERVSRYSMAIAEQLRLDRDTKKLLLMSAICHDIGKIGIPDIILRKASMLNAEEYEEMKLHPTIGEGIVRHLPNAKKISSGIKYHHEKWDGTGYPDGLEGENIPFFGRIIGLADAFDAMISGRAYSGFLEEVDAIERLQNEKELFDPQVFKAFMTAWEKGELTQKTSTKNNEIQPLSKDTSPPAPRGKGKKK